MFTSKQILTALVLGAGLTAGVVSARGANDFLQAFDIMVDFHRTVLISSSAPSELDVTAGGNCGFNADHSCAVALPNEGIEAQGTWKKKANGLVVANFKSGMQEASPDGTKVKLARFANLQFDDLGASGLYLHGTYRSDVVTYADGVKVRVLENGSVKSVIL